MSQIFNDIEYDVTQYTKGYDILFKDDQTLMLVDKIIDLILNGYKQAYICKQMVSELGFKRIYAGNVYTYAFRKMQGDNQKREEGMKEKNLARLEHLYKRAIERDDIKTANQLIETMNKMCGVYKEKIEVSTTDFEFRLGVEKKNEISEDEK